MSGAPLQPDFPTHTTLPMAVIFMFLNYCWQGGEEFDARKILRVLIK
jgi:hypothetical protein